MDRSTFMLMMAAGRQISFVGSTEASGDSSLTIAYPAGAANGDLALLCVYSGRNTLSAAQTGWTEIGTGDAFSRCYYKVVNGTSDYTVSETGNGPFVAVMQVFRNASGVAQSAQSSANPGQPDPPSLSSIKSGNAVAIFSGTTAANISQTAPSGYTLANEISRTFTQSASLMGGYKLWAGASENPGTTGSSSAFAKGITIELQRSS